MATQFARSTQRDIILSGHLESHQPHQNRFKVNKVKNIVAARNVNFSPTARRLIWRLLYFFKLHPINNKSEHFSQQKLDVPTILSPKPVYE